MARSFEVHLATVAGKNAAESVRVGEVLRFRHFAGLADDPLTIGLINSSDQIVGIVPSDHWISKSMHEDRQAYSATVSSIDDSGVVTITATQKGAPKPSDELGAVPDKRPKWFWPAIVGGAFVALIVLGTLTAPTPEEREAQEAERAAQQLAEEEAEAAAEEQARVDSIAGVAEWRSGMLAAMSGCDQATTIMASSFTAIGEGRGSTFDGYRAGERVEDACFQSWRAVGDVNVPEADDEGEELMESAVEACEFAMLARQNAGEAAQELFDGPLLNSNMAALSDAVDEGTQQVLRCAAGIAVVANHFELPADE